MIIIQKKRGFCVLQNITLIPCTVLSVCCSVISQSFDFTSYCKHLLTTNHHARPLLKSLAIVQTVVQDKPCHFSVNIRFDPLALIAHVSSVIIKLKAKKAKIIVLRRKSKCWETLLHFLRQ